MLRYGSEEGFGQKNEVKKEKWIRKHMLNRTCGADFRELRGLTRNPNKGGPLYDIPDWSFADGRPGIPRLVNGINR